MLNNSLESSVRICYLRDARSLYDNDGGLYYGTPGSAGADIRAAIESPYTLEVNAKTYIPTGLSIAMPEYIMGGVYSRSGLGSKFGIVVTQGVGVIDSDYRGEIMVALSNRGDKAYTIQVGERIAQLVFHYILHPKLEHVTVLDETERGKGAFGSTGRE